MIRRYPCQIVLLYILGVLAVKGFLMGYGIPAQESGVLRQKFRVTDAGVLQREIPVLEYGVLIAGTALIGAAVLAGIWIHREPAGRVRLRQAALLLLAFGIGAARMYGVSDEMERQSAGLLDDEPVTVQGRIIKKQYKEPDGEEQGNDQKNDQIQDPTASQKQDQVQNLIQSQKDPELQWTVCLTDSYLKTSRGIQPVGNIILYLNAEEPVIGNTITASGRIKLFSQARNEGNFDERAYYQNQGYSLKVYADAGSYKAVKPHTDKLREFLYHIQQEFVQVYESRMPEEEAGVLSAMLLGEKTLLTGETKELYRQSGIAHILAISGLHISILGSTLYRLLRRQGASFAAAGLASVCLLLLFALMAGMSVSTMRAVIMFGVYLGAACCGRAYDSVNGLAAAAAILLLQNPRALFLAGFQFSFAAVAGVLFGRKLCGILKPVFKPAETIYMSFGIQMLTLPLTAWYYFEIPMYSVLLNMLALPIMELALVTGLAGGGLSLFAAGPLLALPGISGFGWLCGQLSQGILYVCTMLLRFLSGAGSFFLRFPGAVFVTGRPQIWKMAGYFIMLTGCLIMLHYIVNRQKAAAAGACLLCLALLFVPCPKPAEVSVLDVGQGDGIYIHTSDGLDVMIDGGSNDVKKVGVYRILPFLKSRGVAEIDSWFVSHLDQDHISGLREAIESGYGIRQVVFAKGVVRDEAYEELTGMLTERQIAIGHLDKGGVLRGRNACFTCLAPEAGKVSNDRNEDSLTLLYEDRGFRGFFSGDIASEVEKKLAKEGDLPDVSLYKAAHHGSKHSNSEELLRRLKPRISVVSCGEKNRYGHPGEEAVAHMEANSGLVCYTMKGGQVRVRW